MRYYQKRVELGCAGHFIMSHACRFRRHTQVPGYRISTVGDMYYERGVEKLLGESGRQTIGAGDDSFFETLVFKTTNKPVANSEGCGCYEVVEWSEIDGKRYATAGQAQAGHEAFVAAYLAKPAAPRIREGRKKA